MVIPDNYLNIYYIFNFFIIIKDNYKKRWPLWLNFFIIIKDNYKKRWPLWLNFFINLLSKIIIKNVGLYGATFVGS